MRRPSSIRIGGRDWGVRFLPVAQMGDNGGLTQYGKGRLDIRTGMTAFDTRDTVLHETFHAILHRHGFSRTEEVEEQFVNTLATELIGVLQDNPEFAKWLIEPIPKHE